MERGGADTTTRWLVGLLAVAALLVLVQPVIEASCHAPIPQAYNEGWNAYHALSLREGRSLYPRGGGLANNYPPLSFAVNAALSQGLGGADLVIVGRFVALAALLAVIALLYSLLRAGEARPWLAACVALGTLCLLGATLRVYIAMNDPQWLAQALTLAGAVVLLRRPTAATAIAGSAVLMLAGGFAKNALLAVPAASALWLLIQSPRALGWWILAALSALAAATALCLYCFGLDFLHSVLGTPRTFSVSDGWAKFHAWDRATVPGLGVGILAVGYLLERGPLGAVGRFAMCYWLASLAWAAVMISGAGIWVNALFEPLIATVFVVGLALEAMLRDRFLLPGTRLQLAPVALAVAITAVALVAGLRFAVATMDLRTLPQRIIETREIVARLAAEHGPVSCETLALCFWAGRRVEFDYFNAGQAVRLDQRFMGSIRDDIERRKFALMQFSTPGMLGSTRFPPELNDLIGTGYRVALNTSLGVLATARASVP
jgi:hypothetical protein